MTTRTKLSVLERAHALLMLAAGGAVGYVALLLIPNSTTDGITGTDVLELVVAVLAAYAAALLADTALDRCTGPVRRRLYRAADQA